MQSRIAGGKQASLAALRLQSSPDSASSLGTDSWLALWPLQHGVGLLLRQAGIDPAKPGEPSGRVQALAQQPSQRIEAIKAYREETGAGLRAAVKVIDSFKDSGGR